MPTLVICGVVLTIVLVCITGITLTNSINISNIVKLREKVASDSAAANGGHQAAQTRAALVEQQYSTLQQHHMSKSDLNYISAATHPKNLQRLLHATPPPPAPPPNKIVIEIGLRNSGSSNNNNNESSLSGGASLMPMPHMLQAADALMEGNVDSISLPAAAIAAAAAATTNSSPTEVSERQHISKNKREIEGERVTVPQRQCADCSSVAAAAAFEFQPRNAADIDDGGRQSDSESKQSKAKKITELELTRTVPSVAEVQTERKCDRCKAGV